MGKSGICINKYHLFIIYNSNIFKKEGNIENRILPIVSKTIGCSLILTFYKTIAKTINQIFILGNFFLRVLFNI